MAKANYRELLKKIVALDDPPHKIALSFAVGVYISISPFFGFHTILAIAVSFIFKLNKLATITGSWMNNPWTLAPVYYVDFKIGSILIGNHVDFKLKPFTMEHYLHGGKDLFLDVLIGSIIFGVVAAFFSYHILKFFIEKHRQRRKHVSTKG